MNAIPPKNNSVRLTSALGASYLKTAWRKMKRQKGYAFINVASLAVGLAGALFIWLWVQDELSFDRFHANAPALFRVEQDQIGGQGTFHVYVTQYPMGPAIQGAIPEIKRSVRYARASGLLVRCGEKAFFEDAVRAVDPAFLEILHLPHRPGRPDHRPLRPDLHRPDGRDGRRSISGPRIPSARPWSSTTSTPWP